MVAGFMYFALPRCPVTSCASAASDSNAGFKAPVRLKPLGFWVQGFRVYGFERGGGGS